MPYVDEAHLILKRARDAGLEASEYGRHLASQVTVLNYIRIANEIKAAMQNGTILDWGCGFGQMSFLLQRRGLTVRSYDVADRAYSEPSSVFQEVLISRGDDPIKIPFSDAAFDAVLSCGVLEHVPNEAGSLAEIHRTLRDGGWLFVYNLPQRGSYKEFLLSMMHAGYVHERKYTLASAIDLLERAKFRVVAVRRAGMLPHNLTPFPGMRWLYNLLARPVLTLERIVSAVPLLNQTAESLEIIAVKE